MPSDSALAGVQEGILYFTAKRLRTYLGALLILQIIGSGFFLRAALKGQTDFRTFYATGHMVHSGHLYDYTAELAAQSKFVSPNNYALPFMFPPYVAPIFVPFALFNYKTAYWLFFVLNLGMCAASAWIMYTACPALRAKWRPLIPLLFFSFVPLGNALVFGQVSLVLLLLYVAAYAALQTGRPFLAGVLLACALIKFQIAVPVFLLYVLWRQWRFVAGFAVGAAILALISIRITGLEGLVHYVHSLLFMAGQTSHEAKYGMFAEEMPNLYGLFHTLLPGIYGYVFAALSSLAVMTWAAMRKASFPLALLAGMLVSFHMYPYDLTLLLLPLTVAFEAFYASGHNSRAAYANFYTAVILPFVFLQISHNLWYLLVVPVAVLFVSFVLSKPPLACDPDLKIKLDTAHQPARGFLAT